MAARPCSPTLRSGFAYGEGAFGPATSANGRHGDYHHGDGGARRAGAGLLHASRGRRKTLAVQISHRRGPGPLNLLVANEEQAPRRIGSSSWGKEGPWPQSDSASPMNKTGWRANTAPTAGAGYRQRSTWSSIVPPATFGQWSSPETVRVTAHSSGKQTNHGPCDTRRCHTAIGNRGGTANLPIPRNGRLCKEDCPAAHARIPDHAVQHHDLRRPFASATARSFVFRARAKLSTGQFPFPLNPFVRLIWRLRHLFCTQAASRAVRLE